jgi:hypothetical protein
VINIAKLRDLLAAATPGPWTDGDNEWDIHAVEFTEHDDDCGEDCSGMHASTIVECARDYDLGTKNDRDLIVAAVNALPQLLDELEAERQRIVELEQDVLDERRLHENTRNGFAVCMRDRDAADKEAAELRARIQLVIGELTRKLEVEKKRRIAAQELLPQGFLCTYSENCPDTACPVHGDHASLDDQPWEPFTRRLLHALRHIRAMECERDHDEHNEPCPVRSAKEAIDNRPCSICGNDGYDDRPANVIGSDGKSVLGMVMPAEYEDRRTRVPYDVGVCHTDKDFANMPRCQHSAQSWYRRTADGTMGCDDCDAEKKR